MNPVAPTVSETPAVRRVWVSPWVVTVTIATIVFVVVAAFFLRTKGDGTDYKFYGQWVGKDAPDFTLTDHDGNPLKLSDLKGKLVLMTFGFTHCPNVCPTTLANLSVISRELSPQYKDRMRVLFISVDPARDTPKALKDYVTFYWPSFIGLTGEADDIAKVAKDYGAYYEAVMQQSQVASNYYTINHSAYIYLINPQGQYAVLYDNDKLADHARVEQDIEHILK